jgi:hypothetical protein
LWIEQSQALALLLLVAWMGFLFVNLASALPLMSAVCVPEVVSNSTQGATK